MMRTSFKYDDEEDVQYSGTSYDFHSRAGKVRLSRIWNSLHLSKEFLFSTWTAGHREALLRDRVTDYLYNFLQARFKRFGSKNKFELEYSALKKSASTTKRIKPDVPNIAELEYEKHLKQQSKIRMDGEGKRILQLYVKGNSQLPNQLKKIEKDPVYRINMLNKRLGHLERDFEDRIENPLLYESAEIKRRPLKNDKLDDRCSTAAQVDDGVFLVENDGRASSGFYEPTPSPRMLESTLLKALSEENDSALDISDSETELFEEISKNISNQCSEDDEDKHLSEHENLDDLDSDCLGIEMETVWISPLVRLALNQETTASRFEESEKVLSIFRRKLARSEGLNELILRLKLKATSEAVRPTLHN